MNRNTYHEVRSANARHPYWAGPFHRQEGEINHNDGGRGVYYGGA